MLPEIQLSTLGWIFSKIVSQYRPQILLECGAREASFSRSLAGDIEEIYAFEANKNTFLMYSNKMPENIEYLNLGISNQIGTQNFFTFHENSGFAGSSSLLQKPNTEEANIVQVECVRLDDFLRQNKKTRSKESSIAVWIDTEGTTFQVLESLGSDINEVMGFHLEVETLSFWQGQKTFSDIHRFLKVGKFYPVARDCESEFQFNVIYLNEKLIPKIECKELLQVLQKTAKLESAIEEKQIRLFDLMFPIKA